MTYKYPVLPDTKTESIQSWMNSVAARQASFVLSAPREIALPIWDMDTDATKTIEVGSDMQVNAYKRIMNWSAKIYNDAGDGSFVGQLGFDSLKAYVDGGVTKVDITRTLAGIFDSADFDGTTISRGVLYLEFTF